MFIDQATFTEEWFGSDSCEALAKLARRTRRVDGRVIEIGSWEGRSTIALANAAWPAIVHAVDTWGGSPGEISAQLAAERDVYATFESNIAAETRGNIEAHRQDWRTYFAEDRTPVRLCFIDAEHTYAEVRDTILTVLPFMATAGIVCGDDNHHPPIQRAVFDVLGDAKLDATLWYFQCH